MEAQAALVGADGAVELHAEAAVDLHFAPVVLPRHAEDDLPLGLADALDELLLRKLRVFCNHRHQGLEHFVHGLVELGLAGIAVDDFAVNRVQFRGHSHNHASF